ncbi:MAG: ABC transporter substrate-binding protein [Proteobacteria bacterium]|nr:ABC transporter substrate-binding protein [Pseudomonadota bacterium]
MRSRTRFTLVVITALAVVVAWMVHSCGEQLSERLRGAETSAGTSGTNRGAKQESANQTAPGRIAILSPSATQIVFALGAGHRVVGVSRYATFPPEAKKLAVLGGLEDISYEQMTALRPDLIIVQNASERLEEYAAQRNIPLISLAIETTEDVYVACRVIGRRLGMEKAGDALARKTEQALNKVGSRVAGYKKTSCFISVDRNPGPLVGILSTGRNTFVTQMVEIAGGRNIFDDMQIKYPMISKETLLVRNPNDVLEFKPGMVSEQTRERLKEDWQALSGLSAVANHRIHVIRHDDALIPGPRMAEVAEQIALVLHPEIDGTGESEVEDYGD